MIIEKEMEATRVLISKEEGSVLFYDQNSGNLFYHKNEIEKSISSVLEEIKKIPKRESVFVKTETNVFKINLSTTCNLNCDYCFRNKKCHIRTDVTKAKKIIDFIIDDYAPHIWFYSFSLNLTSESLIEFAKIKEIKNYIDERTKPAFTVRDFKNLESALRYLECFPKDLLGDFSQFDNLEAVVEKMDSLLNLKNLVSFFPIPEGIVLPEWEVNQLRNLQELDLYALRELNLRFLEALFPETILRKPHYAFYICTNGTIFSNEIVDFFKEIKLDSVCISLDGPSCVHNLHRPFNDNKASHAVIVENIKKFMAAGMKVNIAAVVTADYPYPLQLVEYFRGLGASAVSLTAVRAGTRASFDVKSIEKLLEGYEKLFNRLYEDVLKNDYSLIDLLRDDNLFSGIKLLLSKRRILKRCQWNENTIFDDEGDIYPCDYFIGMSRFIRGNISSKQVSDVCEEKIKVNDRPGCRDCWCKYLCGGTCYYNSFINTEDIATPDPVECRLNSGLHILSIQFIQRLLDSDVDLLGFGKRLGMSFDSNVNLEKVFFVKKGIMLSIRGSLSKMDLEIRKAFESLRKNNISFDEKIYISVISISNTKINKILEVIAIVETDKSLDEKLCKEIDCKNVISFDFGRVLACESFSNDKSVEAAKKMLYQTVEKYKIPIKGHLWYKGTLEAFLGYREEKLELFVERMGNVF